MTGDSDQSVSSAFQQETASVPEEQAPLESTEAFENGPEDDGFCKICQEKFEKFLDDDSEEWRWKNAIRVGGKVSLSCVVVWCPRN